MSNHSNKKSIFQNEKGYTLIIVLLILMVISITGLGIMNLTSNTMKIMANERDDQSVYYIAESGLVETKSYTDYFATKAYEIAQSEYKKNLALDPEMQESPSQYEKCFYELLKFNIFTKKIGTSCSSIPKITSSEMIFDTFNFTEHFGSTPETNVTINVDENGNTFIFTSVANINGKTRTLTQQLSYTITGLDYNQGESIGDIGVTFTPKYPIHVSGEVLINPNSSAYNINKKMATSLTESEYNSKVKKNEDCGNLCEYDATFPDLTSIIQFVNDNHKSNPNLVYLTNSSDLKGNIKGIVVIKSGDFQITNATIDGIVIAEDSVIKINGQSTINGAIIAKSVDIKNGTINGDFSPDPVRISTKSPYPPADNLNINIDVKPMLEK